MERCRAKLVCALKTGATFALYMGDVRIEHADFKTKLCKKVSKTVVMLLLCIDSSSSSSSGGSSSSGFV